MGYSNLAKNIKISTHYTKGRQARKIDKIVLHHMAGVLTAQQCANVWTNREASAHYCIGSDGVIGCAVDESDTAWACGDWDANISSISIEFSNSSTGGNWPVADKTIQLGIKLIADIAIRHKLGKLVKGKNLCWHSMYMATACPGAYMLSKIDYIISEANKLITANSSTTTPSPAPAALKYKVGDKVVANGYLYTSSTSASPSGTVSNKTTTITLVAPGSAHPYNTTGYLGWMDESSIKLVATTPVAKPTETKVEEYTLLVNLPVYVKAVDAQNGKNSVGTYKAGTYYVYKKADGMINVTTKKGVAGGWINPSKNVKPAATMKVGSKVTVVTPIDYNGTKLNVSGKYDVIEINGDRVVIGKGKTVTAAIKKSYLKLA